MATILIVDTNPTDRRSYITLLGNFGHRFLEADDGAQALELARAELPDLIITDILMPHMDGFELCKKIKKIDQKIKVCFLTASEMYYENFRKKEFALLMMNLTLSYFVK